MRIFVVFATTLVLGAGAFVLVMGVLLPPHTDTWESYQLRVGALLVLSTVFGAIAAATSACTYFELRRVAEARQEAAAP